MDFVIVIQGSGAVDGDEAKTVRNIASDAVSSMAQLKGVTISYHKITTDTVEELLIHDIYPPIESPPNA